jgi:hypothetical protein
MINGVCALSDGGQRQFGSAFSTVIIGGVLWVVYPSSYVPTTSGSSPPQLLAPAERSVPSDAPASGTFQGHVRLRARGAEVKERCSSEAG